MSSKLVTILNTKPQNKKSNLYQKMNSFQSKSVYTKDSFINTEFSINEKMPQFKSGTIQETRRIHQSQLPIRNRTIQFDIKKKPSEPQTKGNEISIQSSETIFDLLNSTSSYENIDSKENRRTSTWMLEPARKSLVPFKKNAQPAITLLKKSLPKAKVSSNLALVKSELDSRRISVYSRAQRCISKPISVKHLPSQGRSNMKAQLPLKFNECSKFVLQKTPDYRIQKNKWGKSSSETKEIVDKCTIGHDSINSCKSFGKSNPNGVISDLLERNTTIKSLRLSDDSTRVLEMELNVLNDLEALLLKDIEEKL